VETLNRGQTLRWRVSKLRDLSLEWKTTLNNCFGIMGLPRWLSGKEPACQCRRHGFNPWVRKLPLEEEMATQSSIFAWRIPWTEQSVQSMG